MGFDNKVLLLKEFLGEGPLTCYNQNTYLITKINMEGRCMKCKTQRTMVDTEEVKMKNGRPAMKGKCEKCGCGMYRILPKK